MGLCTKERKGITAEVLMATPCTNSLLSKSPPPLPCGSFSPVGVSLLGATPLPFRIEPN